MLQQPCAYGNCHTMGTCLKTRQCLLTQTYHMEAVTQYKTYNPLYSALGYNAHYVPTFETTHAVKASATAVSAHSPLTTVAHTSHPVGGVIAGSSYFAPKTSAVLTPALRNTYAGFLNHQKQYLTSHETLLHDYPTVDGYSYHIEQQKHMIDDLHYRV